MLIKQPSESRVYRMDFRFRMSPSDSISEVISMSSEIQSVSISPVSLENKRVSFRISGGNDGESGSIFISVATSSGEIIDGDGILVIKEL
jgi:hypothetical protein